MEEKGNSLELAESRHAIDLVPTWEAQWWWFAVGALVLVLLVLLVFLLMRKKPVVDLLKERREAYMEAKAALAGDKGGDARKTAIRVSLILRRYLARSMGEPALYETHEEFISRHEALNGLPEDVRGEVGACFAKLAAEKYAPEGQIAREPMGTLAEGAALLERMHGA